MEYQVDHSDINMLKRIADILEPFKRITDHMSSDKPMTALILPFKWLLLEAVKEGGEENDLASFKPDIYHDLDSRKIICYDL